MGPADGLHLAGGGFWRQSRLVLSPGGDSQWASAAVTYWDGPCGGWAWTSGPGRRSRFAKTQGPRRWLALESDPKQPHAAPRIQAGSSGAGRRRPRRRGGFAHVECRAGGSRRQRGHGQTEAALGGESSEAECGGGPTSTGLGAASLYGAHREVLPKRHHMHFESLRLFHSSACHTAPML